MNNENYDCVIILTVTEEKSEFYSGTQMRCYVKLAAAPHRRERSGSEARHSAAIETVHP